MSTPDDLTYRQRSNIAHDLRQLERIEQQLADELETLRRLAPAMCHGLDLTASSRTVKEMQRRFEYFQVNNEWPSDGELPKATAGK
jgi:CRISPR/Cas system Type II protein with McrA/HNH and RuvC-like nuclease domain